GMSPRSNGPDREAGMSPRSNGPDREAGMSPSLNRNNGNTGKRNRDDDFYFPDGPQSPNTGSEMSRPLTPEGQESRPLTPEGQRTSNDNPPPLKRLRRTWTAQTHGNATAPTRLNFANHDDFDQNYASPVGPGPLPQEFPPQTTMQDLLQKHAGVNLGSQSSDSQSSGSQSPAMQSSGPVDTGISDELSRLTLVVGSNQGNDSGDEGWGGRSGDGRSEDGRFIDMEQLLRQLQGASLGDPAQGTPRSSREARSPSPQAAASHSGARSPSPQVVNPSPGASSDPSQRQV
ncbi:MAG: hypothetical protein EBS92_05920, partial [Proteobacteria bacterium]|nr:hypothetical protein [Pseudomonadota bacterium]